MDSGAILTSIIGASVATISLAISKDAKVSEFRQQWMDAMRDDVSRFSALALALMLAKDDVREGTLTPERDDAGRQVTLEMNQIAFRIKMRLDFTKERQARVNELCRAATQLLHEPDTTFDALNGTLDTLSDEAIEVLDEAWKQVRRGEKRFRWTFYFALTILVGSLAVLALHWWKDGHRL